MIKIFLIISIVVCCALIGVVIKNQLLIRLNIFKDFKSICKGCSNEIAFLKTDKYTMLKKCSISIKQSCQLVDDYIVLGKCESKYLKTQENKLINDFLNSIGKMDVDGEINNLKYYEDVISNHYFKAEDNYNKYGLFSIKISIIIGTMIAIFLI